MNRRVLFLALALPACASQGKIRVDTPIAPYQKPDISEITGIDEDEEEAKLNPPASAAAAPATATPAPAAPAPGPAKK